jgi:ElaA protein
MSAGELRRATFAALDPLTLYRLLQLRVDVFVVEQACAYRELDGRDVEPGTIHLWLEDDAGAPVAYLRVLDDDRVARIGRVVTAPSRRGEHLGDRLLEAALAATAGTVVLDAQTYLARWYARYGFAVTGPEYLDDGILHVPMRLER